MLARIVNLKPEQDGKIIIEKKWKRITITVVLFLFLIIFACVAFIDDIGNMADITDKEKESGTILFSLLAFFQIGLLAYFHTRKGANTPIIPILLGSLLLILIFGTGGYRIVKEKIKNNSSDNEEIDITKFISYNLNIEEGKVEKPNPTEICIGMLFGIIFGMFDNIGLFIGSDSFGNLLSNNETIQSAWGNTYSDFIGATVGTFVSQIGTYSTGDKGAPIWANSVGIIIGCLLVNLGLWIYASVKERNL